MTLHLLHIILLTQEKRINVVHSVGFILKHEILMNMPGENLKLFHREIEGAESSRFTRWFKLRKLLTISIEWQIIDETQNFLCDFILRKIQMTMNMI